LLEARSAKGAGQELTDEESLRVIRKLVKQGKDSAEIYDQQNRPDLSGQEMAQVRVMETFLPLMMSDQELTAAIAALIEKCGATSLKDLGRVMGMATRELAGKADGKEIAAKVKTLLS
ncbi:MAG TPA: GatB/YqeY domain-containing protein, partial [Prolixibacteraceae bacterium]|nr:GatB/YqeY domain-containing protein [Prolixibacteraceae bacterium]